MSNIGTHLSPVRRVALSGCEPAQLDALKRQKRVTSWPYFSKIKFFGSRTPAAPAAGSYTIPQGTVNRAFSYAVGDAKTTAGFTNADGVATLADTNLTNRRQTTGGQNVLIHGIACQLLPAMGHLTDGDPAGPPRVRMADARLAAAINEAVSVEVSMNGAENNFRLGIPSMIPGAGGFQGGSEDVAGLQALGEGKNLLYPSNGWGVKSNFFRLPEGLIWRNQSNADSNLELIFTATRAIQIFTGGSPENAAADTAADNAFDSVASGTEGYAYPSELVVGFMIYLVGEVIGPRTRSA